MALLQKVGDKVLLGGGAGGAQVIGGVALQQLGDESGGVQLTGVFPRGIGPDGLAAATS